MKSKRKAIHAELRKESQTFDGWLKYEVTIKNEDDTIETIPAYGKDLQDALSRVVHDHKVKKIEDKVVGKVPLTGWVIAWFLGMVLTISLIYGNVEYRYMGIWIVADILIYTFMTLSLSNWFKLRNTRK